VENVLPETYSEGAVHLALSGRPRGLLRQCHKNRLISGTPEEVRKQLGEPTSVSRTPENHILWFYKPSWKLIPGNSGTVVVEFDNGRVAKVFKLN
jgi:hypothetical protein